MNYGVAIFFTDYSIGPVEMGNALEERGFESLWAPEHSHIPLTRKSGYPQGGDLPKKYYDVMDPFVTLTAAATVTKKLKVGTGICLVVQRDPIQTAKSVASLDQISRGRFLFGIGAGWNEDEMADHGTTDFKGRFKLMEERVQAMRAIWTQSKPDRARSGNPHHDVRHTGRARYAEALPDAGIDRVVFSIASEDKDKTLATLDKLAAAMQQTG
ncbi:MAG: class F420-dependent oxidoreductase [Betaproteobacteria bacterium]|nr:class F420-dependent oxidoreductase [Betaproteobacteria bacterium]